jgi:phage shock protein C
MNLSDEMTKLAELYSQGKLNDEEFARAKSRLLDHRGDLTTLPILNSVNALRRSSSERWVAGVCGGLARATKMEVWLWRLLFVLLTLFGGVGLVAYVLMWIFVPEDLQAMGSNR